MERRRFRRNERVRRKAFGARLKDFFRQFVAFMFSNVGIIGLVVGYTIFGALVFKEIEGKESQSRLENVLQLRKATAEQLWNVTCCAHNTFSEENWKNAVTTLITSYQEMVVYAVRNEGFDGENSADKWSFAGAFLYSLTVITTIGYGNVTPHTEIGKMMTVLYAIVGMPLFLLYLSNIGDILAKSFKWLYANLCLCRVCPAVRQRRAMQMAREARAAKVADGSYGASMQNAAVPLPKCDVQLGLTEPWLRDTYPGSRRLSDVEGREAVENEDSEDLESLSDSSEETVASWMEEEEEEECGEEEADDSSEESSFDYDPQTVTVPLTLCVLIMVGYVCGGAALFYEWEDWGILDGSYFCFISLSTIGFGDIVPGDRIYKSNIDLSFIFCAMYLMLGMALIAMCFNLMQEEVISKLRACVRGVRYVMRCDKKAPPR